MATSMSFYIGLCWYIDAMVEDMKGTMEDSDEKADQSAPICMQLIYMEQIKFHSDILE